MPEYIQDRRDRLFIARAMAMHRDTDRLRRLLTAEGCSDVLSSAIITLFRAVNGPKHGKFDDKTLIGDDECREILDWIASQNNPAARVLMDFEPEKVKI